MKSTYVILSELKVEPYKKRSILFSSIFVGLNILDFVETKIALANGLTELNPVANIVFALGIAEFFEAATTLIVLLCFYLLYKIDPKLACNFSCASLIFLLGIVIWNLIQMVLG
ncbi:MAG: DUF5658 family protein [Candidatus Jordarchaeaceae archaeon]